SAQPERCIARDAKNEKPPTSPDTLLTERQTGHTTHAGRAASAAPDTAMRSTNPNSTFEKEATNLPVYPCCRCLQYSRATPQKRINAEDQVGAGAERKKQSVSKSTLPSVDLQPSQLPFSYSAGSTC